MAVNETPIVPPKPAVLVDGGAASKIVSAGGRGFEHGQRSGPRHALPGHIAITAVGLVDNRRCRLTE